MKHAFQLSVRTLMVFLAAAFIFSGVLFAADSELTFKFEFNAPDAKTLGGITNVSMSGLKNYGKIGEPVLPFKQIDILVPSGMAAVDIEAIGERVLIPGDYKVQWGEIPVPIGKMPTEFAKPSETIYSLNRDFPGKAAESISTAKFRGYNILVVHLYPVQYLPAAGKLSYFREITLKVRMANAAAPAVIGLYRGLKKDRAELSNMVINPEASGTYGSTMAGTTEAYDYVLITPNAFRTTFQRLIDYKNSIGVNATVKTVEDIYNDPTFHGVDSAAEVRNFIKWAYQNWGISYVLLGGDDYNDSGQSLVPERACYLAAGGYTDNGAASDFYFGGLDGTWNADNDSYWCEPEEIDYYPEVHVGRATLEDITGINNWLDKDLFYEQNTGHPNLNQCLWLGEQLDGSTWGDDSKDEIIPYFPPDEYEFTKLYDRVGNFTRESCIAEMNQGPHLVNHLGHANDTYNEKIYDSDVNTLTNDSYFFNYSQGCDAGAWDQDYSGNGEAISEHFLFAQGGAFAVVMNSRYGWYSPGSTDGPSQYFDREFFNAVFPLDIRNLGAANDYSRTANASLAMNDEYLRWCYLETNLSGDPHTAIQYLRKPDHDIGVMGLSTPDVMEPGPTTVSANIKNNGLNPESNILVEFKVEDVVQDTKTVVSLAPGLQEKVSFPWTPAEHPRYYTVAIHAVPVPLEEVLTNNQQQKEVAVDYKPVAVATPEYQDAFDHVDANFSGSGSYDLDDSIAEYRWDFGDGGIAYGMSATHQYTSTGTFAARLTVADSYAATGTDTCTAMVWDRGHDMQLVNVGSKKSAGLNKPTNVAVTVKNVGTYLNVTNPTIPPGPSTSDYALVTLTLKGPSGQTKVYTKTIWLIQNQQTDAIFSVTYDAKGTWTNMAHVDISDSIGTINPFPRKDQNPGNNDKQNTSRCR